MINFSRHSQRSIVIGYVGGGRCCDSGVCGAVGGSGIPSWTTKQ